MRRVWSGRQRRKEERKDPSSHEFELLVFGSVEVGVFEDPLFVLLVRDLYVRGFAHRLKSRLVSGEGALRRKGKGRREKGGRVNVERNEVSSGRRFEEEGSRFFERHS